MTGADLAQAAQALVGSPFRLHGRDPATGLDCIGVLAAALGGRTALPGGYRLKTRGLPELSGVAAACGFKPADGAVAPGDVLMVQVGPCQFHLMIAASAGHFIHAHAGLGRVVLWDAPLEWPVVHHWRLAAD